jgi:crotonobetainyl-CoA:carnitine CoA-transferase CaiB-like acyl-CoA transferase
LVYCAISGFGQTGPRAADPAYAPIIHAASGYDHAQLGYQDELTRPEKSGIFTADVLAAIYAFGAIQSALLGRERHGGGQFIDVAMMDSMINLMIIECQISQIPLEAPRILYAPTRALDGFVIVTPISQKNFQDMANAMGHAEWISDPRFDTMVHRRENWSTVLAKIEGWTSQRPARDCEAELMAAGVPCSRYRTITEAMTDPQSVSRGLMVNVENAEGGFQIPNPPFKFADGSVGVTPVAPGLGEHSEEVFAALGVKTTPSGPIRT